MGEEGEAEAVDSWMWMLLGLQKGIPLPNCTRCAGQGCTHVPKEHPAVKVSGAPLHRWGPQHCHGSQDMDFRACPPVRIGAGGFVGA